MQVLEFALWADRTLEVSSPALLEPRRGLCRGLGLELLLELCRGLLLLPLEQSRNLMLELWRRLVQGPSRTLVLKLSRGWLLRMTNSLSTGLGDYRLSRQRGSLLLGGRGSSHWSDRRGRDEVNFRGQLLILVLATHVIAQDDSIRGHVVTNCAFNGSHSFEQFTKLDFQGT